MSGRGGLYWDQKSEAAFLAAAASSSQWEEVPAGKGKRRSGASDAGAGAAGAAGGAATVGSAQAIQKLLATPTHNAKHYSQPDCKQYLLPAR